MPGMDGLRAAREITSQYQVAVMLLTAFSQRDLIEEARDAGVAAYLVKPFQARELLPAVAGVLSRARQEWALAAEESNHPDAAAEDKIATRRVVDLRVHTADGHAEPGPHARRGPADRRRHPHPVAPAPTMGGVTRVWDGEGMRSPSDGSEAVRAW
jgi:response regulator NasT